MTKKCIVCEKEYLPTSKHNRINPRSVNCSRECSKIYARVFIFVHNRYYGNKQTHRVKPTKKKLEEFRDVCKLFIEKRASIDVILHQIQINKWIKLKTKQREGNKYSHGKR